MTMLKGRGEEGDDLEMVEEELFQYHLELEGDVVKPHHDDTQQKA